MPRPTVLVVEPQAERRKELSRGLTSLGYEVIPALDEQQGRRFAEEFAAAVVVAPLSFVANVANGSNAANVANVANVAVGESGEPGESGESSGSGEPGKISGTGGSSDVRVAIDGRRVDAGARVRGAGRTLLLLGESEEQGSELPAEVAYLATRGLDAAELVRRVHVLLLGREVGIAADAHLESLVGDLALVPFLELLRSLHRAEVSGRILHPAGEVILVGGQVIAASAGAASGVKAFCRLSLLAWGPIRVEPALADDESALGRKGGERQIETDTTALIILALEDRMHDAPERRAKLELAIGRAFFEHVFTPSQKEILAVIPVAPTVGQLLDRLPVTDGQILRALQGLVGLGVVALRPDEVTVCVVTDSTSDLTAELARSHGIQVVPLLVIFGDRIFHDGIDLGPREFYEKLEGGTASPRTNPPPRGDFLKIYRELPAGQDILSLHVSEKLSQTIANARAVADEVRPSLAAQRPAGGAAPALAVVDSVSISLGLGLQALFAARMAHRGLDLGAVIRRIELMRDRMHVLFVVDTLDYLARGGRIGKARAAVGKMFGVKPILGIAGGEVVSVDRVRGGRAAQPRLADLFAQRVDPKRPVVVAIGHAKAPIWADRLRSLLQERFVVAELLITEIGPVVGTHTGPGAVGAALFQPTDEELALVAPLSA